jgi:hypothetical protein
MTHRIELKRFWGLIKGAALLLTCVVAVIQIFGWINAPSTKLSAVVEYDTFSWPGGFENLYLKQRRCLSHLSMPEQFMSSESLSAINNKELIRIGEDVDQLIAQCLGDKYDLQLPEPYIGIKGVWRVSLRNNGDQELSNVEVYLPRAILVRITRQGEPDTSVGIQELFHVGRMRPGEGISLEAWSSMEPSEYTSHEVQVSHSGGKASITFLRRVGKLGQFAENFKNPFVLALVVACAILVLSVVNMYESYSKVRTDSVKSGN